MTNDEVRLISEFINSESVVLEYGSGGSTAWFSSSCKFVLSILELSSKPADCGSSNPSR
jgi:hypothetical protein